MEKQIGQPFQHYGERKKWKIIETRDDGYTYQCEQCGKKLFLITDHATYDIGYYRYCTKCGIRLDPPEIKQ